MSPEDHSPILQNKEYARPSSFTPENLLREARRQKSLPEGKIPEICLLDPDGDIVSYLLAEEKADFNKHWACYHTQLYNFKYDGIEFGIVGCAVGSSFAVLVAEEMFASGCQLLISMASASQITPLKKPPYFILIEKAVRDEGTSYHYLPPSVYSKINDDLSDLLQDSFHNCPRPVDKGDTWTTDAPFRETNSAINYYRSQNIRAVEMEAGALYAFSAAKQKPIICFAHITNQMGNVDDDFEKGVANGSKDAIQVIVTAAKEWKAKLTNI